MYAFEQCTEEERAHMTVDPSGGRAPHHTWIGQVVPYATNAKNQKMVAILRALLTGRRVVVDESGVDGVESPGMGMAGGALSLLTNTLNDHDVSFCFWRMGRRQSMLFQQYINIPIVL
jgi:hypothetical protein